MSGSTNTHAKFSPSGSKRWLECTASISKVESLKQERKIPKNSPSSPAAAEGTFKHDLAEEWLRHLLEGASEPEEKPCEKLSIYIDKCVEQAEDADYVGIENQVPLFYTPEETGTCDFTAFHKENNHVYITDLKWGSWVVEAEQNTQLAIYAKSTVDQLIEEYGDDVINSSTTVEITIVQPRVSNPIKTWIISLAELAFFCIPISDTVEKIIHGHDIHFSPSRDNCFFCEAKAFCSAYLGDVREIKNKIPVTVETLEDVDADIHDFLFQNGEKIEDLIAQVRSQYEHQAKEGNMPANTKYIRGRRKNKAWISERAAKVALTEMEASDLFSEPKLRTPTQILKSNPLLKEKIDELYDQAEGSLKLVPESAEGDPVAPETMSFELS